MRAILIMCALVALASVAAADPPEEEAPKPRTPFDRGRFGCTEDCSSIYPDLTISVAL